MFKLGGKLILGVMLTLGIILSVGFYFVLDRQTTGMLEEVRNHTTSISQVVSSGVGEFLSEIQSQHDQIDEHADYLALHSGVQSIEVLNEQRKILAHSDLQLIGALLDNQYSLVVDEVFSIGHQVDLPLPEQGIIKHFVPIMDSERNMDVIGIVILNMEYGAQLDDHADVVSHVVKGSMSRIMRQAKDKRAFVREIVHLLPIPLAPHDGHIEFFLKIEGRGAIPELLADRAILVDEVQLPDHVPIQVCGNQIARAEGEIDLLSIGHRRG